MKAKKRGSALIFGGHDKIIHTFLKNTRPHGGVVTRAVTIVVLMPWLKDTQSKNSIMFNFGPVLGQNSVDCLGFVRHVETTGKVEIPTGAKKKGG